MAKPGRPGAGKPKKKGPSVGTGGHGRQKLEGKGPTPKATDRSWHVAGKRKAAQDRLAEARARHGKGDDKAPQRRAPRPKNNDDSEMVTGRNSVVEVLRRRSRRPRSTSPPGSSTTTG
jgi:23S rRNA (guanosine2251-2'-O)-methyltransferase